MKRILFFLLLPASLSAQDITGIWTGFIFVGGNKLPYEIVITRNEKDLSGYALTVFTINGVENIGVKSLNVKEKKEKIFIEDGELLYDNYTTAARRIKLISTLQLSVEKPVMELSGRFTTRAGDIRQIGNSPYSGTIQLQKKNPEEKAKIIGVLHELDLIGNLSFLQPPKDNPSTVNVNPSKDSSSIVRVNPSKVPSLPVNEKQDQFFAPPIVIKDQPAREFVRKETVVIREVPFRSDSIRIHLYDNGEIDGDTVTILLNGKILMNKIGLTAAGIRQTIFLSPDLGDSILLVMYAENLGSIPPNSGMLVLQDGSQRYDIRFVGDLQKSSAIVLRRKH